jgi:hypothetical protein
VVCVEGLQAAIPSIIATDGQNGICLFINVKLGELFSKSMTKTTSLIVLFPSKSEIFGIIP